MLYYRRVHGALSASGLSPGSLPVGQVCFCVGAGSPVIGTLLAGQRPDGLLGAVLAPGSVCLFVCLPQTGFRGVKCVRVVRRHRGRGGCL